MHLVTLQICNVASQMLTLNMSHIIGNLVTQAKMREISAVAYKLFPLLIDNFKLVSIYFTCEIISICISCANHNT